MRCFTVCVDVFTISPSHLHVSLSSITTDCVYHFPCFYHQVYTFVLARHTLYTLRVFPNSASSPRLGHEYHARTIEPQCSRVTLLERFLIRAHYWSPFFHAGTNVPPYRCAKTPSLESTYKGNLSMEFCIDLVYAIRCQIMIHTEF